MKTALGLLCLVIVIGAAAHHSDPSVPASVPTSPARSSVSTNPSSGSTPPGGRVDGEVDNQGSDPYTALCAGPRVVAVRPDTPAHRADAARLCAESNQDWNTLEHAATQGGSSR